MNAIRKIFPSRDLTLYIPLPLITNFALVLGLVVCSFVACRSNHGPLAVFSTPEGPKKIFLELARTQEERQRGLMFRSDLEDNQGMLFFFEKGTKPSFWMKNTSLSLDIIFLSQDGRVVDVFERLPPCALDPCPSYTSRFPAPYALEVKEGFVARYRIRKGDRVLLVNTPELRKDE